MLSTLLFILVNYNPLLNNDETLELYIETNFKIYIYTGNEYYRKLFKELVEVEVQS